LALNNGQWVAGEPGIGLSLGPEATYLPLDARTANRVLTVDRDEVEVVEMDLIDVSGIAKVWDSVSMSIDYGTNEWVAYSGNSGLQVATQVGGTLIIPTISTAYHSVQLHNNTLFAGLTSADRIDRFVLTQGLAPSINVSATFDLDGFHRLKLSKDGRYLTALSGTNVTLYDASNLNFLGFVSGTDFRSVDIDANNNYLYLATGTEIRRYPIFNQTVGPGGDGGAGVPNPPPGVEPFDEDDVFGDPPPAEFTPPTGGFFGQMINTVAPAWGISTSAVAILIAIVIIGTLMAVFAHISGSPIVMATGGLLGVTFSYMLDLLPEWVLILLVFIAIAGITLALFGGRGNGE